MDKERVLFEEDFENENEYREYIEEEFKKHVYVFMDIHRIGIGSSFFAAIMRHVAEYVDD